MQSRQNAVNCWKSKYKKKVYRNDKSTWRADKAAAAKKIKEYKQKLKKEGNKRMAVSASFVGEVIGYSKNVWTDKLTGQVHERHVYSVLVRQKVDKAVGLPTETQLFEVQEETEVLGDKLKAGTKVQFYVEERRRSKEQGGGTYQVAVDMQAV